MKVTAAVIAALCIGGAALAAEDPTQLTYSDLCAACHGAEQQGTYGPPLRGEKFVQKWKTDALGLRRYIAERMPPANPGQLTAAQLDGLVASLLGFEPSTPQEASGPAREATPAAANNMEETGGAGAIPPNEDDAFRHEMLLRRSMLSQMHEVSGADLLKPPDGDWVNWRRSLDAWGFSPLRDINKSNITHLTQSWSLSLPKGSDEITPLAHDGVLFVDSAGTVMAIDGATGTVLWQKARPVSGLRPFGPPISQPRNMAMSGTTLFVPTLDNHLLALDFRTGAQRWDHLIQASDGILRLTAGPIVARGKVIQGVAGCAGTRQPGGCFVVALDERDGHELWRVNTLQQAGDGPVDTWNDAPQSQRFGGSIWSAGSYDPEENLYYVGTGQTYYVAPLLKRKGRGASSADALYTDSTLAINADTGKLVWHYQHLARDVWDMDAAFERTIAFIEVNGRKRKVVVSVGKLGIIDVLDALSGEFLYAYDLGLQDIVEKIDLRTGRKTTAKQAEPVLNAALSLCPFPSGVRNFPATAYDPERHLLLLPIVRSCMKYVWSDNPDWDIAYTLAPPKDGNNQLGAIIAFDLQTRQIKWVADTRAPRSSGIVSTQPGLLFEGGRDRWFRALDATDGQVLWQRRLSDTPNSFPITYLAGQKQFVAVVAGGGGPSDATWSPLTPEITETSFATVLTAFSIEQ